jgi:CheY-like chemotaxis protein
VHLRKDADPQALTDTLSEPGYESMQRKASIRPVVLIVEDEVLLRRQAAAIVEDAGFDVVEAATADEAITVLETRNDIRLVFTEIQMPGSIDGLRLTHLVKTRWPPVQIIATSGRLRLRDDDLPTGGRYLSKPFDISPKRSKNWSQRE